MKRAALYLRVSTLDQHPEAQLYDLRGMAAQRGFEIVEEYTDRISGVRSKRSGLDQLMPTPATASSMWCWWRPSIVSPAQ